MVAPTLKNSFIIGSPPWIDKGMLMKDIGTLLISEWIVNLQIKTWEVNWIKDYNNIHFLSDLEIRKVFRFWKFGESEAIW